MCQTAQDNTTDQATVEPTVFNIPEENMADFENALTKLNKKCDKLGVPAVGFTQVGTKTYRLIKSLMTGTTSWIARDEPINTKHFEELHEVRKILLVTVQGTAPKFEGWEFVGTLSPVYNQDNKFVTNMVKLLPEKTCPSEYRDLENVCHHCNTKRRRKETFVVQNEQGDYMLVGRSCLKDFLGHTSPEKIAALAANLIELESNLQEFENLGGYVAPSWDLPRFLTQVAHFVRRYGFTPKSSYKADPTANLLEDYFIILTAPAQAVAAQKRFREDHQPTEADEILAAKTIAWVNGLTVEQRQNDYIHNLFAVVTTGMVQQWQIGIVASMITAYQRAHDQETEVKKAKLTSDHIGTIGKRQELTVTVKRIVSIDGQYGTTGLHLMEDATGNRVSWFASSSASWLEAGETYTVKATIKDHGEYKGIKTTQVNRVKEMD